MQRPENPANQNSGALHSEVPINPTNNLNLPLDHTTNHGVTYARDPKYYCMDDIGVFLVDGILFKVKYLGVIYELTLKRIFLRPQQPLFLVFCGPHQ
jgi:hypothetical protein